MALSTIACIQDRCHRGEAHAITVTILGSGSIAGQALSFALKSGKASNVTILTKTTAAGNVVITDPVNRIVTITFIAQETLDLFPGTYVVDLWRTDTGSETDYADGTFTIQQPVRGAGQSATSAGLDFSQPANSGYLLPGIL